MIWIESFLQFAGDALRPVRRVSGIAQELGISVVGIAGIAVIVNEHGGLWGAVAVLSIIVLLFGIEGARREHRLRAVRLELTVGSGTWYGSSPTDPAGFMQYGVSVTNEGADGRFNAAVVSDVHGASAGLPYGHFESAWEGTSEVQPHILTGRTKHVVIGTYRPGTSGFRFRVPPSPHGGGAFYEDGPDQVMKARNWRLEFDFEIRDVERGVAARRRLRVSFANPCAQCPVLTDVTD